jgi:hypothetical protein
MQWWLEGETKAVYTPAGAATVAWQPVVAGSPSPNATRLWFKAAFDLPTPFSANATAYALDLSSMNKGKGREACHRR